MLYEKTELYYVQNQEKFVTDSKQSKRSDVTVAEINKQIIILMEEIKKNRLKGFLVYESIFRKFCFRETYAVIDLSYISITVN